MSNVTFGRLHYAFLNPSTYASNGLSSNYIWTVPVPSTPNVCPVCHGRGHVPGNFYDGLPILTPEKCRSCAGRGVLWR